MGVKKLVAVKLAARIILFASNVLSLTAKC